MRSSTSSSSQRVPDLPFGRIWVVAGILAVAALAGLECLLRAKGAPASVVSTFSLWARERSRVEVGGRQTVAVIGASRAQTFAPAAAAEEAPDCKPINLTVSGEVMLPYLRDIAENTDFSGVVVASWSAGHFLIREPRKSWLARYQNEFAGIARYARIFERDIRSWLQTRLVIAGRMGQPADLIEAWQEGEVDFPYLVMHADRHRAMYFERFGKKRLNDLRKRNGRLLKRLPEAEARQVWPAVLADIRRWAGMIRERGGDLVLVRYPVDGMRRTRDALSRPRAEWWDQISAKTGVLTLHYEDIPGAAAMRCPDYSHLNHDDAREFTRLLVRELVARGVFPRP
ncbi:hypothetical protein HQ560_00045 [bacterium]|nr:hypothetical protein [bacterium]